MARRQARRREDGTVRQLPSGRWQARYWDEATKTQRPAPNRLTFDTKLDAVTWLDKGDRTTEAVARKADPTLAEYAEQWLEERRRSDLKPRTAAEYASILRRCILPTLGDVRVAALTPAMVREWFAAMDPSKPTQRRHAYALLSGILRTAVEDEHLAASPCTVKRATVVKRSTTTRLPTADEVEALAAAMPEHLRAAVILSAYCGLRYGELTELRRRDVRDGRLHVDRAVVRVAGGFLSGTPKSEAGVRAVGVPARFLPMLAEHLERHVDPSPDALLFPARGGQHLAPASLYRHWYAARDLVGLPQLRWHDLRHYAATHAARHHATLAELQQRLGHSTVAAAMRYQHAAQQQDDALTARL
jgi:integrase